MNMTIPQLLPLAGILLGAKLAAQISHRAGLPAVFGELLLGLALGPSLLGWLAPTETLHLLADIGVILLMFMAGLETDVVAMRQPRAGCIGRSRCRSQERGRVGWRARPPLPAGRPQSS